MLEAFLVIGALVGFGALVWWAQREATLSQAQLDDIARLEAAAETKEKSREVSEVADSRRDTSLHVRDDIVSGETVPGWLKRG